MPARASTKSRDVVLWHTAGPRVSAIYDVTGDGRTAAKASVRPLLLRAVDRRRRRQQRESERQLQRAVHLERREQRPRVPARRADRHAGRADARARRRRSIRTSAGPTPTNTAFSVDRELMANFKLSAAYTYRREKNIAGVRQPRQPVRDDADERRSIRGSTASIGTARRWRHTVSSSGISAANRTLITNDPKVAAELQGLGNHADQAPVEPLADAGRIHAVEESNRRRQRRHVAELADQHEREHHSMDPGRLEPCSGCGGERRPTESVQADRDVPPAVAGRDPQRQLPVAAGSAGHASDQPRAGDWRQTRRSTWSRSATRASARSRTIDVRVGKLFRFGKSRSLEATIDFDNLTNADTVWSVRDR